MEVITCSEYPLIGRGSFSNVYGISETRAAKVILNFRGDLPAVVEKEIKALRTINSPYVISLLEVRVTQQEIALIMPRSLCNILHAINEKISFDARTIISDLCLGIQAIHQAKIAHRDLRLPNLLLTPEHRLLVADLGRCHLEVDKEDLSLDIWMAGLCLGDILLGIQAGFYRDFLHLLYKLPAFVPITRRNPRHPLHGEFTLTIPEQDKRDLFRIQIRALLIENKIDLLNADFVATFLDPNRETRFDIETILKSSWFLK